MKKILYVLTGLVASLALFSSCSKDMEFLTEDPKNLFTKENAFEKPAQIDAALVKAYNRFQELNTIASLFSGRSTNFLKGAGSDIIGGGFRDSESSYFSNYWNLQTNNSNFLGVWNDMYQLAAYANFVFEGLEIIQDIDEAEAKYLAAQANFFKGWAYLRLGEMFGGVPIQEELSEELKFDYERASREDTYTYAITCLEAAVADLPETPKAAGRVAKGMANHILAEAYLARAIETDDKNGDLDKAIAAATWTINKHPLMTERFGSRSLNGTQPAGIPDNGVARYKEDGNVFYDLFQIGNVAYGANGNTESLMVVVQPQYSQVSQYGGSMIAWGITVNPNYRDATWTPEYMDKQKQMLIDEHGKEKGEELAKKLASGPWPTNNYIDLTLFPGGQLGLQLTGSWGVLASCDYADYTVWEGDLADDIRNSEICFWNPVVMDKNSPLHLQKVTPEMINTIKYHARSSCKYTMTDWWGWDLQHSSSMGMPYVNQYGRDWYIARSAETYLIRAEAKLRKGDKAGAAEDINTVRSRSQATKLFGADEVTLFTILDERARELLWEEYRWATLLRMGKGGQDTPGSNEVMKTQLSNYTFSTQLDPSFKGRELPEWTLFPIPFNVIQLNSELEMKQNHGWK